MMFLFRVAYYAQKYFFDICVVLALMLLYYSGENLWGLFIVTGVYLLHLYVNHKHEKVMKKEEELGELSDEELIDEFMQQNDES